MRHPPPPFNFFHHLTSSSAARHRWPLLSHHPPPTTCALHFVRLFVSASCALSLPSAAHSRDIVHLEIPSFPGGRSHLPPTLRLPFCRPAVASPPWLVVASPPPVMPLPTIHQRFCLLFAASPHQPAPCIISMHHYRTTPASIAPGRQFFKCFNFVSLNNGTSARHIGRIAPNQDVHSLPTVCRG